MKYKIILSFILIVTIAISINLPVSAEDSFTPEDAMQLFQDAETLYLVFERGDESYWTDPSNDDTRVDASWKWDKTEYKDNVIKEKLGTANAETYFHYRVTSYVYGGATYPIDNRTDLEKLAGLYFTKDTAKTFIDDFLSYYTANPYYEEVATPLFIDENDKVYHLGWGMSYQFYVGYRAIGYTNFVCEGDRASIDLLLHRTWHKLVDEGEYLRFPVEFVKTSEGWRISEDVFNTILHNRPNNEAHYEGPYREYLIENPNTSDSTVVATTILGTVAIISLALPVVIYKRRRRAA